MRITEQDLEVLNRRFEGAPPIELLRFTHAPFGDPAAILSSMQRAGALMCSLAEKAGLSLDVVFVDTGVLHAETLWTRDELARTHKRLRVITLHPDRTFAAQTADEGVLYLTREGQERCCDLRKSEPLRRVRGRYDALIGALRRGEGGARSRIKPFGLDASMNALRVHPLASVTNEELDALIASTEGVVVNPLHRMGFPTIGCFTCTTPVRPDEPERAGRWRHLAGVDYCGINPVDLGEAPPSIELDSRYADLLRTEAPAHAYA
jgi:phosphoadenosine phosphosulfate reductase